MDSSENSERQVSDNHQTENTAPAKQSDSDYTYDDDFEELDTFIEEKSRDSSSTNTASQQDSGENSNGHDDSQKLNSSHKENGQPVGTDISTEDSSDSTPKPESPSAFDDPQSDDSELEPEGDVLFTDDQQRAMLELMAQKKDSGDYSDDPPEYNVKERLKELNAELAMEPDPDDRQHRVGFKEELVDLVAPPPEVSDDDDTPRKAPATEGDKENAPAGDQGKTEKSKQFVVERDGKFDVVADHELTASERAMFMVDGNQSKTSDSENQGRSGGGDGQSDVNNSNSQVNKNIHPVPPSKPRPNTANGYSRRTTRPAQSPRPQTASSNRYSRNQSSLLDFNYNSPYAMSSRDKELAQEQAKLKEKRKKEEEDRRKQEEEYQRQESEDAFQAWLKKKRDDDKKRQKEEDERRTKNAKEDKTKENEDAYHGWLKVKQTQMKREKLLQKREEQELKDGYYVRSREECDQAYKEWLKKKYAEIKRQRALEKQRVRSFRSYSRRSRKQQMIARAVRQAQAFRYVDYYGYRF